MTEIAGRPAASAPPATRPAAGAANARHRYGIGRGAAVALAIVLLLALVPLAANLTDDSYLTIFATRIMIFAIAAVSLDFILGYGAMVSFGHAVYLGIGAYAVGILYAHDVRDAAIALPVAILGSAIFAAATGAISLRTRGVYFIMITLAFGQMAFFTANSLSAYGGDDGLTIWGRSRVFGTQVLENDIVFFYVVLACLAAVLFICRAFVGSRFGQVIRAAKQSETRVRAVGINPYPYKLVAFTLAGMMAGTGGFLFANQAEFVSPAYMTWQRSGELIVMVVFGGMATLHGAVIGAAAFLLLEEYLSQVTQHWKLLFGPFLILIVLFARGGIAGLFGRLRAGRGSGGGDGGDGGGSGGGGHG